MAALNARLSRRGRIVGMCMIAAAAVLVTNSSADAGDASSLCRKEPRVSSRNVTPGQWAYSGVRKRSYVRRRRDCPCQVVIRRFRSRVKYECPCLAPQ